jgi:hypothetical protein
MRIVVQSAKRGLQVRVFGAGAALLVIGALALLRALGGAPSAQEAETRLRLVLAREVSQAHMEELKASGATLPDEPTATRWQADLEAIERAEVRDIEVRRPLPDAFSARPAFVIRAVVKPPAAEPRTRYFWLGRHGFDHEASVAAWHFAR